MLNSVNGICFLKEESVSLGALGRQCLFADVFGEDGMEVERGKSLPQTAFVGSSLGVASDTPVLALRALLLASKVTWGVLLKLSV